MVGPRALRTSAVLTAVMMGALAGAAAADSPQFTVQAAYYSFTAYNQTTSGWVCDSLSDLSHGVGCYGEYPASAVFGEPPRITQNPGTNGTIFWYTNPGEARDTGFLEPQQYDELVSWQANGPQGGPHKLRQVLYDRDRTTANSSPPLSWANDHDGSQNEAQRYVNNSAFYEPSLSKHVLSTSIFASANFPSDPMSGLYIVETSNGYDNFFWYEIFRALRPNGASSGAEWHFNKAALVDDPTNSSRWIGLIHVVHPTDGNLVSPFYIDFNRKVIGFKFANAGWCEYPWGVHFTDFNSGYNTFTTCADSNYNASNHEARIPDVFAGQGGPYAGTDFKTLAVVNGQILSLRSQGTTTQPTYVDSHALCPPAPYDHSLYATRSRQDPFNGSTTYYTQELSINTWNSSAGGLVWVGSQKQILDGSQAQNLKIQPTDSNALGGFAATLHQYNNGSIYLYLNAKVTLCEPDSNPALAAWDRFPIAASGGAVIWFRLTGN